MKIYNTSKGTKEEFSPLFSNKVNMYVCGVTPYDEPHLGHARCYVIFDVIKKYLSYKGYEVKYVRNYTDIDDKIIARSKELGKSAFEIADKFIEIYKENMKMLNVEPPFLEPRVTENIPDIIEFIGELIKKGVAYEIEGNVYFSIDKFPDYGKLSRRTLDEMKVGARVNPDEKKRNPLDFALWKKAKPEEPYWESAWGRGRPGWHIECSVMSIKYLGDTIDIHGGGQDLIFPHHENEVAQSESYTGKDFVRCWIHNGFVTLNKEKMSKSLGNFFSLKEIFKEYAPQVVRLFMLWQHYTTPLDFSKEKLEEAKKVLDNLLQFYRKCNFYIEKTQDSIQQDTGDIQYYYDELSKSKEEFIKAMDDDFNTAQGFAAINGLITITNIFIQKRKGKLSLKDRSFIKECLDVFNELGGILGLDFSLPVSLSEELMILIQEREKARMIKDWKKSDELRENLAEKGIVLEDTALGVFWRWR